MSDAARDERGAEEARSGGGTDLLRLRASEAMLAVNRALSAYDATDPAGGADFASLPEKLDALEAILGAGQGPDVEDFYLKEALREIEAALRGLARRRRQAAAATPPNGRPEGAPRAGFPFRSDLLSQLNAAMPVQAQVPAGGRNDLAELARKLDDMCRGVSHSRAGELSLDGASTSRWPDSSSLSELRAPRAARAADASFKTSATGLESEPRQQAFTPDAPHPSEADAADANRLIDADLNSSSGSRQNDDIADPREVSAETTSPSALLEQDWPAAPQRNARRVGQDRVQDEVPHSPASAEISARIEAPDHVSLRTTEAPLDDLDSRHLERDSAGPSSVSPAEDYGATAPKDEERSGNDALLDRIEAYGRQLSARMEAGLASASAETSKLTKMVGTLADKIQSVSGDSSIDAAIEALEREMGRLAERLDATDKAFASLSSLDHSIAGLFSQIEELRRNASEAASAAPSATTSATAIEFPSPSGQGAPSVAEEIANLRAAQEAADRRTDLTLSALRETVDKVADRLVKAEADIGLLRPARLGSLLGPSLTPLFTHRPQDQAPGRAAWGSSSNNPAAPAQIAFEGRPLGEGGAPESSEILLEPGSGLPQRGATSLPAEDEAPQSVQTKLEPQKITGSSIAHYLEAGLGGRADFIAAARRAAQAAQKDLLESADDRAEVPAPLNPGRASQTDRQRRRLFATRRRPIALVIAAFLLATSAYALARKLIETTQVDDLAPGILEKLEKGLIHGFARPSSENKADVGRRRQAATSAQAVARPSESSQSDAPSPSADQQIGPVSSIQDVGGGKAIVGSAPIKANSFETGASVAEAAPAGATPALLETSRRGVENLEELAEAGDAMAQFDLALRFEDGRDRPRDLKSAAQWFDRAARQGLAKAQYRLATLYEKGLGAPRDLARAVKLYLAAAEQGNTRAMHNLGVLAVENSDNRPNYVTAALWFAKAAEAGVADSQFNLAVLLARGFGTPQNLVQAYAWFAIAAAQGDPEAAKRRDELGARLNAADLAAGRKTAESFRPQPVDQAANEAPGLRAPSKTTLQSGREDGTLPVARSDWTEMSNQQELAPNQ